LSFELELEVEAKSFPFIIAKNDIFLKFCHEEKIENGTKRKGGTQ